MRTSSAYLVSLLPGHRRCGRCDTLVRVICSNLILNYNTKINITGVFFLAVKKDIVWMLLYRIYSLFLNIIDCATLYIFLMCFLIY